MSRLAIVYHRAFARAADGSLWEAEGAFSKYVESLAPYFDATKKLRIFRERLGLSEREIGELKAQAVI